MLDEIIVFVNKIVKIVHECAKEWDGDPINNNGDKYLLCWKLPNKKDCRDYMGGNLKKHIDNKPIIDDDIKIN